MTALAIKLLVRVVVFGGVFAVAAHRHPKISIAPRVAIPLVGLVFALLNTGLYWILKPIVTMATLGGLALAIPLLLNGLFLWATARVLRPLKLAGARPMIYLAVLLTVAHGLLYVVLDVLAA